MICGRFRSGSGGNLFLIFMLTFSTAGLCCTPFRKTMTKHCKGFGFCRCPGGPSKSASSRRGYFNTGVCEIIVVRDPMRS